MVDLPNPVDDPHYYDEQSYQSANAPKVLGRKDPLTFNVQVVIRVAVFAVNLLIPQDECGGAVGMALFVLALANLDDLGAYFQEL